MTAEEIKARLRAVVHSRLSRLLAEAGGATIGVCAVCGGDAVLAEGARPETGGRLLCLDCMADRMVEGERREMG